MNKYEESLEDIKYFIDKTKVYKKLQKYNLTSTIDNLQELVDLTKKENQSNLLDRNIPKKATKGENVHFGENSDVTFYNCPVCNSHVGDDYGIDNYCGNCGQAIGGIEE